MIILTKILNTIKKRLNKKSSQKTVLLRYSRIQKINDGDEDLYKSYLEYKTFDLCQCDATYHISLYFPKEVKPNLKFEIFIYVKDYFEQSIDPVMIFFHTGMKYNMSIAHKSIPEQKKIFLFIGKDHI